jgi:hypothetical protein
VLPAVSLHKRRRDSGGTVATWWRDGDRVHRCGDVETGGSGSALHGGDGQCIVL